MQFVAKLLKRVPVGEGVPTLLAVLALAGIFGRGAPFIREFLDILGSYWG